MSVVASPVNSAPARVRTAISFLLTAVALGVAETLLVAGQAAFAGWLESVAGELIIRGGVYAALTWLVLRLRRGGNGTRITVIVLLGVFGTLSMVVGPAIWLLDHPIVAFVSGADAITLLFAAMRTLHVVAVLSGVAMLFTPEAKAFFRKR